MPLLSVFKGITYSNRFIAADLNRLQYRDVDRLSVIAVEASGLPPRDAKYLLFKVPCNPKWEPENSLLQSELSALIIPRSFILNHKKERRIRTAANSPLFCL